MLRRESTEVATVKCFRFSIYFRIFKTIRQFSADALHETARLSYTFENTVAVMKSTRQVRAACYTPFGSGSVEHER